MASEPSSTGSQDALIIALGVILVVVIVVLGAIWMVSTQIGPFEPPEDDVVSLNMSITSARWEELDAGGMPASDGCLCLWLSATIENNHTEDVSVYSWYFKLRMTTGADYSAKSVWGPDSLAPGGSGTYSMIFDVPKSLTPSTVIYDGSWDVTFSSSVPVPEPLVPDVVMTVSEATFRWYDLNDLVYPDKCFLWLQISITNQWWSELDTDRLAFDVEGVGGEMKYCWDKTGPDTVDSGSSVQITANFLVELDFEPSVLHFEMLFGPSASAPIPEAT